jgi:hypothetical protein
MTNPDRALFEDLNRRLTLASCLVMRLAHGHPDESQQAALERSAAEALARAMDTARSRWPSLERGAK